MNKIDRLDAELLVCHVIDRPREFLVSNPNFKITKIQEIRYKRMMTKRARGIPLAYLTGHKEFYDLDFIVNKHTLIPRPDTELLVTEALEHLSTRALNHSTTRPPDQTILIDVGTGSGCIPIAITGALEHWSTGALDVYATDISRKALRVAKKNAKKYDVDITFLHGNLLEPFLKSSELTPYGHQCSLRTQNSELIITANLPYLTEEQFQNEPSIQHEPKSALVADDKGLALYEELLKQIQPLLSTFDFRLSTFFEIDPEQTESISKLIKQYIPKSNVEIKKDLSGLDRVVKIQWNSGLFS